MPTLGIGIGKMGPAGVANFIRYGIGSSAPWLPPLGWCCAQSHRHRLARPHRCSGIQWKAPPVLSGVFDHAGSGETISFICPEKRYLEEESPLAISRSLCER